MSNTTTYLGRSMQRFTSSPQFDGFSKVIIIVSDEIEYAAGNDTGRVLRIINPWGTPQMAQDILNDIRGFQYQPYTAEGSLIDPSAELGDGVTANNVYSGIYTQKIRFGSLLTATVSAPEDEELNHEYPYKSKPNKEITREAKLLRAEMRIQEDRITMEVEERKSAVEQLTATLKIQADQIATEVSERKSETSVLRSSITQESQRITAEIETRTQETGSLKSTVDMQAGQIATKVSKSGGNASSFEWNMTDAYMLWKANGSKIFNLDKNGAEVYGKIVAKSGKIGGFDILPDYLSYNGQTWGGTNTWGAYLGTSGFQMGRNFQVDMAGNLYAASGRFSGTVYAGNIQYGDDVGYLPGGGIAGGSIYGDRLVGGTITTAYTSSGINGSLGRADSAYNIVTGYSKFTTLKGATLSANDIKLGEEARTLGTTQITYKDGNDKTKTLNVVTWS